MATDAVFENLRSTGLTTFGTLKGASTGSPSAGTYATGEFYTDSAGTWWFCTSGGTPGTWRTVSEAFPRSGYLMVNSREYSSLSSALSASSSGTLILLNGSKTASSAISLTNGAILSGLGYPASIIQLNTTMGGDGGACSITSGTVQNLTIRSGGTVGTGSVVTFTSCTVIGVRVDAGTLAPTLAIVGGNVAGGRFECDVTFTGTPFLNFPVITGTVTGAFDGYYIDSAGDIQPPVGGSLSLSADAEDLLTLVSDVLGFVDAPANVVLAGPTTGSDAPPTLRALVTADVPSSIARVADAVMDGDVAGGGLAGTYPNPTIVDDAAQVSKLYESDFGAVAGSVDASGNLNWVTGDMYLPDGTGVKQRFNSFIAVSDDFETDNFTSQFTVSNTSPFTNSGFTAGWTPSLNNLYGNNAANEYFAYQSTPAATNYFIRTRGFVRNLGSLNAGLRLDDGTNNNYITFVICPNTTYTPGLSMLKVLYRTGGGSVTTVTYPDFIIFSEQPWIAIYRNYTGTNFGVYFGKNPAGTLMGSQTISINFNPTRGGFYITGSVASNYVAQFDSFTIA